MLSTLLVAHNILSLTNPSTSTASPSTTLCWELDALDTVATTLPNLSYTSSTLYFPCPASCTSKSTNSTLSATLKQPAIPLW